MQFKKIIAAIDTNDELADDVLRTAQSLADKDGATLDAVTVWPPLSAYTPSFSGDIAVGAAAVNQAAVDQHREGRALCEKKLAAMVSKYAPRAAKIVLDGDPADKTGQYAAESNADLIVTGSHQRGFWGALWQGSASREVIHDAPCAVFLVTKRFVKKLSGG
jgi:nucleotide-binding universal stress UspA family protein